MDIDNLNILHISKSDFDGGAAIAALRICKSQQKKENLSSQLLVQQKKSNLDQIIQADLNSVKKTINFIFDESSIRLLTNSSNGRFTFPFLGNDISKFSIVRNANVINLHWINGGFLSLDSLKKLIALNKPIVWTLHDMWSFTGGCHYSSTCEKYTHNCYDCPSLIIRSASDLSNKIFSLKEKLYKNAKLSIVTCSNWLAIEAKRSKLLSDKNITVIPNPIDTELFKPLNKLECRKELNLPQDKKLILIGAMNLKDKRKGVDYLIDAVNLLAETDKELISKIEIVTFGKLEDNVVNKLPVKINQLGKLASERKIVCAYNSADIFLAPSLQDNLPNTVLESLSCGIPVVAFSIGGIPDMIDHLQNGYLVKPESSINLAEGIKFVLSERELYKKMVITARNKVLNNFTEEIISKKYIELYKSIA